MGVGHMGGAIPGWCIAPVPQEQSAARKGHLQGPSTLGAFFCCCQTQESSTGLGHYVRPVGGTELTPKHRLSTFSGSSLGLGPTRIRESPVSWSSHSMGALRQQIGPQI